MGHGINSANYNQRILKTIQPYFGLVWDGIKTAEVRKLDRDFQVGQEWYLDEYYIYTDPNGHFHSQFGSKRIHIKITHILSYKEFPEAFRDGWGMISFQRIENLFINNSL